SGKIVKYQVSDEKEVTPESIDIINATTDSRLTVYTCSGFLDSARFVVIAKQV
ncbi:sortase, partial [Candidatus Curtissbacteria bacterium]|nr:sortase [Candidatus Curtissbacteria bacterium]